MNWFSKLKKLCAYDISSYGYWLLPNGQMVEAEGAFAHLNYLIEQGFVGNHNEIYKEAINQGYVRIVFHGGLSIIEGRAATNLTPKQKAIIKTVFLQLKKRHRQENAFYIILGDEESQIQTAQQLDNVLRGELVTAQIADKY